MRRILGIARTAIESVGLLANRQPLVTSVFLCAAMCLLFWQLVFPIFEVNDDAFMMLIGSGTLTGEPSERLVFMNILLGWLLKGLYTVFPTVNWYGALLYLVQYLSMLALCSAFARPKHSLRSLVSFTLICFAYLVYLVANPNFTSSAAWAAIAGLALVFARSRDRTSWLIFGVLLIVLGSMVRFHGMLLGAAAVSPAALYWLKPALSRRWLIVVAVGAALSLAAAAYHSWEYSNDPEWETYTRYNRLRSEIHDTPLVYAAPHLDEAVEDVGWTVNDALILRQWLFADPVVYSYDRLSGFVQALRSQPQEPLSYTEPIARLWHYEGTTWFLLVCCAGLLWGARRQKLLFVATATLTLVTVFAIYVYLDHFAKIRLRLVQPLMGGALTVALLWVTEPLAGPHLPRQPIIRRVSYTAIGVLGLLFLFITTRSLGEIDRRNRALHENLGSSLRALKSSQQDATHVLFVPIGTSLPFGGLSPWKSAESFRDIPILLNGWLTHSPHYQEALSRYGLADLFWGIVRGNDIRFVADAKTYRRLRQFMGQHYGLSVRAKYAPLRPGISIYYGFTAKRRYLDRIDEGTRADARTQRLVVNVGDCAPQEAGGTFRECLIPVPTGNLWVEKLIGHGEENGTSALIVSRLYLMTMPGERYLLGTCTMNGGRSLTAKRCKSVNLLKRGVSGRGWLAVGIHYVSKGATPQTAGFRMDTLEIEYATTAPLP